MSPNVRIPGLVATLSYKLLPQPIFDRCAPRCKPLSSTPSHLHVSCLLPPSLCSCSPLPAMFTMHPASNAHAVCRPFLDRNSCRSLDYHLGHPAPREWSTCEPLDVQRLCCHQSPSTFLSSPQPHTITLVGSSSQTHQPLFLGRLRVVKVNDQSAMTDANSSQMRLFK